MTHLIGQYPVSTHRIVHVFQKSVDYAELNAEQSKLIAHVQMHVYIILKAKQ